MSKRVLALLSVLTVLGSACGKRVPEPVGGAARGVPHVSWVIMHGDSDNPDADFACQSNPRNDCIVPASRPDSKVFSDVHFYYHGSGPQTRFTGTVNLGFLGESPNSAIFPVNARAEKAESIGYESITGIVSSKPGTYEVTIEVVGSVGETGTNEPIREKIAVVVR